MKANSHRWNCSGVTAVSVGALWLFAASVAMSQPPNAKEELLTDGTVSAGNGIYSVFLEDLGFGNCGTWTATTAGLHPAGTGLNVLFGGGFPSTSNSTLRSYTSGTFYVTGTSGGCTPICGVSGPPAVTPVLKDAVTVGYIFSWVIIDAGNMIVFEQEVVVEGPVDGTETVDNTVIRETHTVRNLGPGTLDFGLRKHWDFQIGPDDGPWLGDCETPDEACFRSVNLTGDGSLDGFYPQSYVINDDPLISTCPSPGGCTGAPLYIVAGTVQPPSNLSPPPDPPELLQFNEWSALTSDCWIPALSDNALCGAIGFPTDDTSIAYFYGATAATAETVGPGEERSYTQYVVAGEETCPEIFSTLPVSVDIKPESCPNSFNRGNKGVLPVALLSTADIDVTLIDLSTVQLSRSDGLGGSVDAIRSAFEDVATVFDGELCDCLELGGDGIVDLSIKFASSLVTSVLELDEFSKNDLVPLDVTGFLLDGTEFRGSDCIRIVK